MDTVVLRKKFWGFTYQDVIKIIQFYQVLNLGKYNLRWTTKRDILRCVIMGLIQIEPKCRSSVWKPEDTPWFSSL